FFTWLGISAQLSPNVLQTISTPNKVSTKLGSLTFKDGIPDAASAQKLYDEADYIHGVDAFVNGYPVVSQWAIREGFKSVGVNDNDVIVFSKLMDSNSLFLTANADTYYFWTYLDLSKGPVVLETPSNTIGVIDDMWWRWITDIGTPGPDRGEGGKYIIVPPDYKGILPEGGFFVHHSKTLQAGVLGRAFLENDDPKISDENVKKNLKIYPYIPGTSGTSIGAFLNGKAPLAAPKPAPALKFVEGSGLAINTIPPTDYSFFEMLNAAVQAQPASALEPEIAGQFAAIGIVKGKPFQPDARMKKILTQAAEVGNALSRTISFAPRQEEGFSYYGKGNYWVNPLFVGGYEFQTPPPTITKEGVKQGIDDGAKKLNARIAMFYSATGITPAMCMRLVNIGSQYLGGFYDSEGQAFDGGKTYKIVIPANIPAAKFWSITLYDNQTRSMLQTPQKYPRAGSQSFPSPAAQKNLDGTYTIYIGPKKPSGVQDGNWIQTTPGKGWFTLFRFYSPLEPFFDKSWVTPNFEKIK
ncbi:DUF1254 domain-containing protein, partial [Flavobacterium nitrogenifigens]|uniref:DUF1254 domain-containing protein n=1 Tax=Flavobacterium nitrogenifigens TaxID=1617283 RepID=UPI0031B05CE8